MKLATSRLSVRSAQQISKRTVSRRMSTKFTREKETFQLPDGRTLGYAEYGTADGKPMIYLHGFPSSRIEARPIDEYARRHGIRVLALDRPGCGISSPQPNRTLLDWSADVEAFATGMKLPSFALLGTSGGGPFAVACAHSLPPKLLTRVGLFATGPPWAAGRHYMSYSRRVLSFMATCMPSVLKVIMDGVLGISRWLVSTGPVTRRLDSWLELVNKQAAEKAKEEGKQEPEARPIPEQRANVLNLLLGEPFAQGTGALVVEAKLLSANDWGFPLSEVQYPIKIWHGTKDSNAPIEAIRCLADEMPNASLKEFTEDTHYTMGQHIEAAVGELMEIEETKVEDDQTSGKT